MNAKLYVGNLAPSASEAELRLLFSRAGAVSEVQVMLDPASGQPRGCAYVTMATAEGAAAAVRDLHGSPLEGRFISVTEARPPQEPKGQMSEGFESGMWAGLGREGQPQKQRGRSGGGGGRRRRRGRGRGRGR